MTDASFDQWLSEQPKDAFPEGTPDERIYNFYQMFQQRKQRRENEKAMSRISNEIADEEAERQRLRAERAADALSEPNPMERFIAAFKLSHIGHYQILRAIIYAECLKSSRTTKGLQPTVTGKRGSGKSHGARTAIHLLPKDAKYVGTVSDKYLYHADPEPKTTFFMDDVDLSDELVSFLKRKQSEFQEDTTYGTMVDRKWTTVSVRKRMVFIITSTMQQGGNQLSDRALSIDIKNEERDDIEFYQFERDRRMKGLPEFPECDEVQLCRDMLSHIREREFQVIVPELDFAFYHDRRLIGQVYDLMEASAILNYMSRDHIDDAGVIHVTADQRDLDNALDFDMFKIADKDTDDRLLKTERDFDVKVQKLLDGKGSMTFTQKELAERTGTNESTMKKYLFGLGNTAESFGEGDGLCGKTTWYQPDKQKDPVTDAVKVHITVSKHVYLDIDQCSSRFAWVCGDTPT